jgi:serpin B
LPKFRIESEILPENHLKVMGFGNMFSDEADFSRISETEKLKVGSIFHKAMIELDEKGTEATAVSKVEMVVVGWNGQGEAPSRPVPKVFTADHPFIFLLIDNRTNAVIFTGRFVTN